MPGWIQRCGQGRAGAQVVAATAALCLYGCFDPIFNDGQFTCGPEEQCPPGQSCVEGQCRSIVDPDAPDADLSRRDAGATDASSSCAEFRSDHFDACLIEEPGGSLSLNESGEYIFDTDTAELQSPVNDILVLTGGILSGSERLISTDSFAISENATLRVVGTRSLVIASFSTMTVDGRIDVSSGRVLGPGPGADGVECGASNGQSGENSTTGAGGSGGGGYATAGGNGGDGDSNGAGANGGAAGIAIGSPPNRVRAGCAGADGGDGQGSTGGAGGNGGGAIQLTAATSIAVTGLIHAGGAGGARGVMIDGGGGGGGSGGFIGLEAPTIDLAGASLAAKGGGGGEGSDDADTGNHGEDGRSGPGAAQGGSGGAPGGGNGGNGAATAGAGQNGGPVEQGGGGGGGGGLGFILTRGVVTGATSNTSSPPITPL